MSTLTPHLRRCSITACRGGGKLWVQPGGYASTAATPSTSPDSSHTTRKATSSVKVTLHAQTAATFENFDKVLDGLWRHRNQVAETTVMIIGRRENFGDVETGHREYFGDHRPVSTALGVVELALPGQAGGDLCHRPTRSSQVSFGRLVRHRADPNVSGIQIRSTPEFYTPGRGPAEAHVKINESWVWGDLWRPAISMHTRR